MLAISENSLEGGSLFDMQATHHLTGHAGDDFVVESRGLVGLISQSQVDDRDVAEYGDFRPLLSLGRSWTSAPASCEVRTPGHMGASETVGDVQGVCKLVLINVRAAMHNAWVVGLDITTYFVGRSWCAGPREWSLCP